MKKIVLLVVLFWASVVLASTAPTTKYSITVNSVTSYYDTGQGACDSVKGFWSDATYYGPSAWNGSGCYNASGSAFRIRVTVVSMCWDNSQPVGGVCPDQNPCQSKTGTAGTVGYPVGYVGADGRPVGGTSLPSTGTTVNVSGCEAKISGGATSCTAPANGPYPALVTCNYPTTYTGSTSSSPTPSAPPAPNTAADSQGKCPSGTVNGGTDSAGVPICIGGTSTNSTAPSSSSSTSSTKDNGDGTKTSTTTTTQKNSDGSTTTTTTTKTTDASGGTVSESSSSTTGKNSLGQDGKSDEDSKGDLCKLHPDLNVCKNSTVGGTCGNITCTGDAIQCAILREQAARNCQDKSDKDAINGDPAYTLGNRVMNGDDPQASSLPTIDNAASVAMPSSLDSSGWLGGGACFPDKQFTVQGHSITLSFASACQPLLTFRYALMVIALLISFRMLSGVIFRE